MANNAPGKHYRQGISLVEAVRQFDDEAAVERLFVETRWPHGVACVECGSMNIQERPTRKPQPYRCRDCRKDFSVRTGTVMQGSNLPLTKWAMAIYLMSTNLKGISSLKLHPGSENHPEGGLASQPPNTQGGGRPMAVCSRGR